MGYKNQYKKYNKMGMAILFFMVLSIVSYAQTEHLIKSSYSFFTEQLPGNIMVDTNGKPYPIKIDTINIIYIETTTQKINWETVYKNGIAYSIASQLIMAAPFKAGKTQNSNADIMLGVEKNNFLWQLYIVPQLAQKEKIEIIRQKNTWIKGKYKGKLFFKKIADPVQLTAIPSV